MSLADEVGGGLDGLSQLRMLMASGRKPGILVALDFEFVEVETGRAVFAGTPGKHVYNPIGTVHGGYAATLLDSACGCAVHSRLTASQAYTTLDLKVAYHKPITKDTGLLRWWADPIAALIMVPIIAKEGIDGITTRTCG